MLHVVDEPQPWDTGALTQKAVSLCTSVLTF